MLTNNVNNDGQQVESPAEELARLQHLVLGSSACANDDNIDARINELIDMLQVPLTFAAEIDLDGMTSAELDGVEEIETDGFDYSGQASCPDYRPDSAFEFATNQ